MLTTGTKNHRMNIFTLPLYYNKGSIIMYLVTYQEIEDIEILIKVAIFVVFVTAAHSKN